MSEMNRGLLQQFPEQFSFTPVIQNRNSIPLQPVSVVLGGMGGSQFGGSFLRLIEPSTDVLIHRDYGVPAYGQKSTDTLFVASSYSGNTEEVLDFAARAYDKKYPLAAITGGGALRSFALERELPLIEIQKSSIPPRAAIGMQTIALAALLNKKQVLADLQSLTDTLSAQRIEEEGRALAQTLLKKIPLIYTSARNATLGYYWKIAMNESGKIPAFSNVLPEADHNEIEGFDGVGPVPPSSFHALFIRDPADHPRIRRRMDETADLFTKRGVSMSMLDIAGSTGAERYFGSAYQALATALMLAEGYGNESLATPLIDELKRRLGKGGGTMGGA
jgi:glucose/mannose-6-phosphate isomerase